jgi:hypothetical protein
MGGDVVAQDGYSPTATKQLVTWLFFGGVFVAAWTIAIIGSIKHLDQQFESRRFRRPYIMILGAYSFTLALFNIAMLSLLSYCACIVLCTTAKLAPMWWQRFMHAVALPSTLFNCLSLDHVKFHGVMFFALLIAVTIMTWGYVTDDDMRSIYAGTGSSAAGTGSSAASDPDAFDRLRSKIIRILLIVPAGILLVGYGLYALYSIASAHALATQIAELSNAPEPPGKVRAAWVKLLQKLPGHPYPPASSEASAT